LFKTDCWRSFVMSSPPCAMRCRLLSAARFVYSVGIVAALNIVYNIVFNIIIVMKV
jgi:hypothetical protein